MKFKTKAAFQISKQKSLQLYCLIYALFSLGAYSNNSDNPIENTPLIFAQTRGTKSNQKTLCGNSEFFASKNLIQHCGNNPIMINEKNLGDFGEIWKLKNPVSIFWEQRLENLSDKLVVELIDSQTGKPWPTKSYGRKFDSKTILEIKPSKRIRDRTFYLTAHVFDPKSTKKASWIKKLYIN